MKFRLLAIFIFLFPVNLYAGKNVKIDSFTISQSEGITIERTLAYGLFKEEGEFEFKYDGEEREGRIWKDYFVHTKLLKSKGGLFDTSDDYRNQFVIEDGNYVLYTEFDNWSSPTLMNWVTPSSMLIDTFAKINSKGEFITVINALKNLTYKIKNISGALDTVIVPLEMIVTETLEEDDPFRKNIVDIYNIKTTVDEILSKIPTDTIEVNKTETIFQTFSGLLDFNDERVKTLKNELSDTNTWKNILLREFAREMLKTVTVKRRINGKDYDTLNIYLYKNLHLGEVIIPSGNYMPIDYVILLLTDPARTDKSYWYPILRYFTKSGNTNAIIQKLKSNYASLKDIGNVLKNINTVTEKMNVAQLEGVANYIIQEVKSRLLEKLENVGVNLATELTQYLVPGAGQAKAVLKGVKLANTLGKFTYDSFTAPRVIPFRVEGADVYLSVFTDLYKYSYFLYPNDINDIADDKYFQGTYESYFLYGNGYEEYGFKPYDINNRIATLAAEGVAFSYTFNLGAYGARGDVIKTHVKECYDRWIDDPIFEVTYETLTYNDNLHNTPETFISPITGVTNKANPMKLKFSDGSAELFDTMERYDTYKGFKPAEFIANEDADSFTYVSFQELFTHHLKEVHEDFWGNPSESFWESYKNNKGIHFLTPGIFKMQTTINILPVEEDEDKLTFGDDHWMFVMARIKASGNEETSNRVLPKIKDYNITHEEDHTFIIDISLTEKTDRNMLFSIYDISKTDSDTTAGFSIEIPKGEKQVKAYLPQYLFYKNTEYSIFYHDALTKDYSDFIGVSERKILLDIYKERVDSELTNAIRRTIGYIDDFESEKIIKNLIYEPPVSIFVQAMGGDKYGNWRIVSVTPENTTQGIGEEGSVKVEINGIEMPINWQPDGIYINDVYSLIGISFEDMKSPITVKILTSKGDVIDQIYYPFSDIGQDRAYTEAIMHLWRNGIISGYTSLKSNTFNPEGYINRAEFCKIAVLAKRDKKGNIEAELPEENSQSKEKKCLFFSDIERGSWYENYVEEARRAEIVKGYPDCSFKPGNPINDAEAVTMVFRAFFKIDQTKAALYGQTDVPWYQMFLDEFLKLKIVNIENFKPDKNITRGEMADMIYQASQKSPK